MVETEVIMVAPKFKISLTVQQTLEVGRLSVIWGQIDHFVLCSVSLLLAHDLAAGTTLMGDMTTGPLVNLLNKSRHRIDDKEIKELTKNFCADMGPLIKTRNHIMHGIWGFYLPGKNPKKAKPGCLFMKDPNNPVFPEKVTDTANMAAEQTHAISQIWHYLTSQPFPEGQPKYFFRQHAPTTPKRMTTTTPLQALSLLNNSLVFYLAEHLAQRVAKENGNNLQKQIESVYQRSLSRSANQDESEIALSFIKTHGLPAFCRVLFNSNEFIYVR